MGIYALPVRLESNQCRALRHRDQGLTILVNGIPSYRNMFQIQIN